MPEPRHPVSVRGAALVQTERLQVLTGPTALGVGSVDSCPDPLSSSLQTYAFSVCWSDGSDTLVHRRWNEFKQLKVSDPGV